MIANNHISTASLLNKFFVNIKNHLNRREIGYTHVVYDLSSEGYLL